MIQHHEKLHQRGVLLPDDEKKRIVVYESPLKQIRDLRDADDAAKFLRQAFDLGMFNKIMYTDKDGGGFYEAVTSQNIQTVIDQIIKDADSGKLPSCYSLGMNASYNPVENTVNTKLFEKEH